MAQIDVGQILQQGSRLGVELLAGPSSGSTVTRVEIAALAEIDSLPEGTLMIVDAQESPSGYRIDIAIRQSQAHGVSALVFPMHVDVSATARHLAEDAGIPLIGAAGRKASDLALAIDRMVSNESSDVLTRAQHALARARDAAAGGSGGTSSAVLEAASASLGGRVWLEPDPQIDWTESAAVFIGDVPRGRLLFETDADDDAVATDAAELALPGVAAVFSRVMLHEVQDRFAPRQTSGELIAQLIVAESSRLDSLANQAYQLGVPLQLAHGVSWLKFTHSQSKRLRPPKALQSTLELFALELFDQRPELWHIAFVHDDAFIVVTEAPRSGDHQRRLREVSASVADQAQVLGAGDWDVTVGLGTPQSGADGLRQSAAEARVAAESAISSGRTGHIEVTDVTGLRRVLLDFFASPISRELLRDILSPLDAQGREKAETSVRTLLAYLGHRNSPTKAGAQLSLHPNAVSYRIRNIESMLGLDLNDPDTRFSVELACRVRLLGYT
ncbi:PucR family transcriptional regulator [Brevibacterium sp. FME17]|uniref:PucR family transcriptional regulator n=1 Tax=Brevibacterium sp. FME17 TaxID=2742606 RepID=UPI001865DB37|nr:PucR family transcriptional regulator [Brevibacterium sp. FME17]